MSLLTDALRQQRRSQVANIPQGMPLRTAARLRSSSMARPRAVPPPPPIPLPPTSRQRNEDDEDTSTTVPAPPPPIELPDTSYSRPTISPEGEALVKPPSLWEQVKHEAFGLDDSLKMVSIHSLQSVWGIKKFVTDQVADVLPGTGNADRWILGANPDEGDDAAQATYDRTGDRGKAYAQGIRHYFPLLNDTGEMFAEFDPAGFSGDKDWYLPQRQKDVREGRIVGSLLNDAGAIATIASLGKGIIGAEGGVAAGSAIPEAAAARTSLFRTPAFIAESRLGSAVGRATSRLPGRAAVPEVVAPEVGSSVPPVRPYIGSSTPLVEGGPKITPPSGLRAAYRNFKGIPINETTPALERMGTTWKALDKISVGANWLDPSTGLLWGAGKVTGPLAARATPAMGRLVTPILASMQRGAEKMNRGVESLRNWDVAREAVDEARTVPPQVEMTPVRYMQEQIPAVDAPAELKDFATRIIPNNLDDALIGFSELAKNEGEAFLPEAIQRYNATHESSVHVTVEDVRNWESYQDGSMQRDHPELHRVITETMDLAKETAQRGAEVLIEDKIIQPEQLAHMTRITNGQPFDEIDHETRRRLYTEPVRASDGTFLADLDATAREEAIKNHDVIDVDIQMPFMGDQMERVAERLRAEMVRLEDKLTKLEAEAEPFRSEADTKAALLASRPRPGGEVKIKYIADLEGVRDGLQVELDDVMRQIDELDYQLEQGAAAGGDMLVPLQQQAKSIEAKLEHLRQTEEINRFNQQLGDEFEIVDRRLEVRGLRNVKRLAEFLRRQQEDYETPRSVGEELTQSDVYRMQRNIGLVAEYLNETFLDESRAGVTGTYERIACVLAKQGVFVDTDTISVVMHDPMLSGDPLIIDAIEVIQREIEQLNLEQHAALMQGMSDLVHWEGEYGEWLRREDNTEFDMVNTFEALLLDMWGYEGAANPLSEFNVRDAADLFFPAALQRLNVDGGTPKYTVQALFNTFSPDRALRMRATRAGAIDFLSELQNEHLAKVLDEGALYLQQNEAKFSSIPEPKRGVGQADTGPSKLMTGSDTINMMVRAGLMRLEETFGEFVPDTFVEMHRRRVAQELGIPVELVDMAIDEPERYQAAIKRTAEEAMRDFTQSIEAGMIHPEILGDIIEAIEERQQAGLDAGTLERDLIEFITAAVDEKYRGALGDEWDVVAQAYDYASIRAAIDPEFRENRWNPEESAAKVETMLDEWVLGEDLARINGQINDFLDEYPGARGYPEGLERRSELTGKLEAAFKAVEEAKRAIPEGSPFNEDIYQHPGGDGPGVERRADVIGPDGELKPVPYKPGAPHPAEAELKEAGYSDWEHLVADHAVAHEKVLQYDDDIQRTRDDLTATADRLAYLPENLRDATRQGELRGRNKRHIRKMRSTLRQISSEPLGNVQRVEGIAGEYTFKLTGMAGRLAEKYGLDDMLLGIYRDMRKQMKNREIRYLPDMGVQMESVFAWVMQEHLYDRISPDDQGALANAIARSEMEALVDRIQETSDEGVATSYTESGDRIAEGPARFAALEQRDPDVAAKMTPDALSEPVLGQSLVAPRRIYKEVRNKMERMQEDPRFKNALPQDWVVNWDLAQKKWMNSYRQLMDGIMDDSLKVIPKRLRTPAQRGRHQFTVAVDMAMDLIDAGEIYAADLVLRNTEQIATSLIQHMVELGRNETTYMSGQIRPTSGGFAGTKLKSAQDLAVDELGKGMLNSEGMRSQNLEDVTASNIKSMQEVIVTQALRKIAAQPNLTKSLGEVAGKWIEMETQRNGGVPPQMLDVRKYLEKQGYTIIDLSGADRLPRPQLIPGKAPKVPYGIDAAGTFRIKGVDGLGFPLDPLDEFGNPMEGFDPTDDVMQGLELRVMDSNLAARVKDYLNPNTNKVFRMYDQGVQIWKIATLAYSTTWTVFNAMGNISMSLWGGGMSLPKMIEHGIALKRAMAEAQARLSPEARRGPHKVSLKRAARDQVLREYAPPRLFAHGQNWAEMQAIGKLTEGEGKLDNFVDFLSNRERGIIGRFTDRMYYINELTDNFFRTIHYMDELERRAPKIPRNLLTADGSMRPDLTPLEEAKWAEANKEYHAQVEKAIRQTLIVMGDFTKQAPIERKIIKRIFPFWPWMRHQMIMSYRLPLNNPLRYALMMSLTDETFQELGENESDLKAGMISATEELKSFFGLDPESLVMSDLGGSVPFIGIGQSPLGREPGADTGGSTLFSPETALRSMSPVITKPATVLFGLDVPAAAEESRPLGQFNLNPFGTTSSQSAFNRMLHGTPGESWVGGRLGGLSEAAYIATGAAPSTKSLRDLALTAVDARPRYDTGDPVPYADAAQGNWAYRLAQALRPPGLPRVYDTQLEIARSRD